MVSASQSRRLASLAFLLVAALLGLGYRLVDLQVLRHDELSAKARHNTERVYTLEPRRGDIRDVKGNLFAASRPVKTVCANPEFIGERHAEVARALAPILQLNETELHRRIVPQVHLNTNGIIVTNRFVVLKKRVSLETWQQVTNVMAGLSFGIDEKQLPKAERPFYRNLRHKAIFAPQPDDQERTYPAGALASHVIGYTGAWEHDVDGRHVVETAGMDGIERMFNAKLTGMRGWRQTETDRKSRELVPLRLQDIEARDGLNVVLTIDAGLQNIVEAELAAAVQKHTPISATVIMVRPRTGEILAMATLPNYNPNDLGSVTPDARRNRAIADIAEPGSTFKIVVVSAALNEGIITLNDTIDCEHGKFFYAGKWLKEHESHGYGVISVENIIAKSSNIGSAKIGIKLGDLGLHTYIRNFGFGERTGIQLPGEVSGIVHSLKSWYPISISRIPMGHEVAVTPLQMVMAMSAIANGGRLMRPSIVDHLEDEEGHVVARYQPQLARTVVSPVTARQMVEALKGVVSTNGTAVKARLPYYTVAGKTGTAQKAINGAYVPGKYFTSFIGFFPADNPELCISVVMDEPKNGYYGGIVAAPCFKNIAERAANYLNIRPDSTPPGALAATAPVVPPVLQN